MKYILALHTFEDGGFFESRCVLGTDDQEAMDLAVQRAKNTSLTPGAPANRINPAQYATAPGRTGFPVRVIEVEEIADYSKDLVFPGRLFKNVKEVAGELNMNYHVLARAMKLAAPNTCVIKGVTLQFERDFSKSQEEIDEVNRQLAEAEAQIAREQEAKAKQEQDANIAKVAALQRQLEQLRAAQVSPTQEAQ